MMYGGRFPELQSKSRLHCTACDESWLAAHSGVCPDCGAVGEIGELYMGGVKSQTMRPTRIAQTIVEREGGWATDADVAGQVTE